MPQSNFQDHFRKSPYAQKYIDKAGSALAGFRMFGHENWANWVNEMFPAHTPEESRTELSEEQARTIIKDLILTAVQDHEIKSIIKGNDDRDAIIRQYADFGMRCLVAGERESRWTTPVVEGVFTEDYWIETSTAAINELIEDAKPSKSDDLLIPAGPRTPAPGA